MKVEVLKDEYETNLMYSAHVAEKPNTIFTQKYQHNQIRDSDRWMEEEITSKAMAVLGEI
jgi:hypothetical protein